MEYQQQIHIGPGLESICRIPQKTNADTADTEKASATQNKSKIGYTKYRESICKTKEKQDRIHQIPRKHLQLKIKARQDTPDTGKVSAKQKKSKWRCKFICPPVWKASAEVKEDKCRYPKCRESICKIPQKSNADTSVLQKVSPALLSHKCRCILLSKTNSYCIIQGIIL